MIEIIRDPESGSHEYLYTMGEVSKLLNLRDQNGKTIGRNRFFKVLIHNKAILRDHTPSQFMINSGLCVMHKTTKRWKTYTLITFTEKGINYLESAFKSGKYQAYVEPKQIEVNTVKLSDIV
jgi:phage antirepressor YoqD-like protein